MPRGRKGPPQESIDTILAVLSRRDDIEPVLLSHYMDRLDGEWAEGAREKVMNLLRGNDALAQAAALHILADLATDFDLDELEDFVADPTVSDLAKLSLSPILKKLDSEMADEGIIEYLNDPPGAIRQMQMRLLELVGQNEMGIETILEDVVSMPLERRLAFINWLGNSDDPRAVHLLIPLLENQTSKIIDAVIEALETLGPITVHQSIPALNRLIATTTNREMKQHARAALGRLTMQSMLGTEENTLLEVRQQVLPEHEARVSSIDGSGTQLIMLSWLRPDGLVKGVNVLSLDQKGIKDCYGIDEMNAEQWRGLRNDLDEQGFHCFVVPFAYARALLLDMRALNRRSRFKVPIAYSIWRPLIEGASAPKKPSALPPVSLKLQPLSPEVLALLQRGAEIYQLKEFTSWLYESIERIEPYIARYWSSQEPGARTRGGRKNKLKEQEQDVLLDQLAQEACAALLDDKWRTQYAIRLLRQAALFKQAGKEEQVPLLQAVASGLHPSAQLSLQEQPFAMAFMRLSIEQGPLRLMVESLRNGDFSAFPMELFDQPPR